MNKFESFFTREDGEPGVGCWLGAVIMVIFSAGVLLALR